MDTHDLVCQFADCSSGDSAPIGEYTELARHAARERQFLFHQKNGQPFLFV